MLFTIRIQIESDHIIGVHRWCNHRDALIEQVQHLEYSQGLVAWIEPSELGG